MPKIKEDITGKRYGKLVVLSFHGKKKKMYLWKCQCDCGKETLADRSRLTLGRTKSCGCYKKEHTKTHGKSKTATYSTWARMINRCENEKCDKYKFYGGRGIKVCKTWRNDFEKFLQDMGERPSNKHSLDRIDVNGDYCKDNCRWLTIKEQNRNRRSNINIEYMGVIYCLTDFCTKLGIDFKWVRQRVRKYGYPIESIISGAKQIIN
jgi:hypothetical protein